VRAIRREVVFDELRATSPGIGCFDSSGTFADSRRGLALAEREF